MNEGNIPPDGTHGLVVGGPFENEIVTDPEFLKNGFMRGSNKDFRWHEYTVHERGDGTKLFLYAGSRESINGKA